MNRGESTRIIPKRTKVSTEFFKGASIADTLVGFFGVLVMFLVFISSLPHRLWIDLGLLFFFGLLLTRIDEEPNYMFLLQLLRHFSHERRFQRTDADSPAAKSKKDLKKSKKREKERLKQQKKQAKQQKKQEKKAAGKKKKGGAPESEPDPEPSGPEQEEEGREPSLSADGRGLAGGKE